MKDSPLSKTVQILLIIFIIFGIYYPAIFAEPLSTDDRLLITNLLNIEKIDLKSLFIPESPVTYYRPLLYLTYIFDGKVFGGLESFMHLENIVIHAISSIIVFLLTKNIITFFRIRTNRYFPLFVSLVFALHPINTESVNWISGRTDLLAGMFVFMSMFILLRKNNLQGIFIASLFYLFGLFCKEVAIGTLAIVFLFILLRDQKGSLFIKGNRIFMIIIFISITVLYFGLRTGFNLQSDEGISTVAKAEGMSIYIAFRGLMKAMGFYMKKLFIPLPLNLVIISIPTYIYFPLGIIVTVTMLILLSLLVFNKKLDISGRFIAFWFLFAIIFYLPAVPLAIARMTWTPLAERYLYISSLSSAMIVTYLISRVREKVFILIMAIILIASATVTAKRTIVWQRNLTLWEDTVRKSPDSAAARNDYAIALWRAGRLKEAKEQFLIASKLVGEKDIATPMTNLALVDLEEGNTYEGIKRLRSILESKNLDNRNRIKILKKLIYITEQKTLNLKNNKESISLYRELVSYYGDLFKITHNGFYSYRLGQLHLALGEKKEAIEAFKEAVRLSPNEYFSPAARKLIKRLQTELEKEKIQ
jgi:tetratricopeptide (TPR) repeat protein